MLVENKLVDLVALQKALESEFDNAAIFKNEYEINHYVDNFIEKNVELVAYHQALDLDPEATLCCDENIDNIDDVRFVQNKFVRELAEKLELLNKNLDSLYENEI